MKHIFTALAFGAFAITSTAIAQPSDVDTCYSADCENGLNSMTDGLQTVDLYMELEGLGIDGGFLFDGDNGPDPIKVQCITDCKKSVEKSHTECIAGVFHSRRHVENFGDSEVELRNILKAVCEETTKKKFQECRVRNDCAIF